MCSTAVFWGCSGTLGVSFGMQTAQVFVFDFSFDISRRFRSSWGELHTLGAILEPLGAHLGRSGGSWGGLWGVRGRLGASLSRLGAILEAILRQRDFRTFFGSILGSFWAPKGMGNGAEVGLRSNPNRRRKRRCEKKRFRIVLGRSWGGLGVVLERSGPNLRSSWDDLQAVGGAESLVFHRFFNTF